LRNSRSRGAHDGKKLTEQIFLSLLSKSQLEAEIRIFSPENNEQGKIIARSFENSVRISFHTHDLSTAVSDKPFNYIINPSTLTSPNGQDSFSLNNPSVKELKDEISAMRNEELENDDISGRWSKILVTLK
jgi:hypothetical protein